MKKNCVIIGSSASNLGALLMLDEVLINFKSKFQKFYISVPFEKDKETIKKLAESHGIIFELIEWRIINILISYFLSNFLYLKKFTKTNRAFLNSEFTLDISGICFVENRGLKYLIYNLICIYLPSNTNSKIIKLPQSFGPINSKSYMKIASKSLKKCFLIFTRGTSSFNLLNNMGIKSTESLDLGLLNLIDEDKISPNKQTVGIVPSIIVKNKYKKNNQDYVSQIYKLIKNNKNKRFIVFNHTYSEKNNNFSDNFLIDELKTYIKSDTKNVEIKNNIQNLDELIKVYSELDTIITSRYHSLVLAIKHGVYPLVIGWNQKYNDLLEKFELENSIINTNFKNSNNDFQNINKLLKTSIELRVPKFNMDIFKMNDHVKNKLFTINYDSKI